MHYFILDNQSCPATFLLVFSKWNAAANVAPRTYIVYNLQFGICRKTIAAREVAPSNVIVRRQFAHHVNLVKQILLSSRDLLSLIYIKHSDNASPNRVILNKKYETPIISLTYKKAVNF